MIGAVGSASKRGGITIERPVRNEGRRREVEGSCLVVVPRGGRRGNQSMQGRFSGVSLRVRTKKFINIVQDENPESRVAPGRPLSIS